MRLLAVSPSSLRGGSELVLSRVCGAALARSWDVTCACPPGELADDLAAMGVETAQLPELGLPSGGRAIGSARLLARLAVAGRVLRRQRAADVVLVNGPLALPAVGLARLARLGRLDAPVVLAIHEIVRRRDRVTLLRLFRRVPESVIAVSGAAAAAASDVGLDPVHVVPNGTPWPVDPAEWLPSSARVIGCVAALTPCKGQDILLEAVALVPDVAVELIGQARPKDHDYADSLRRRAARPDLAGRVRFLGFSADPLAQVREWRLAVSASTEPEAVPLTVIEAMSVGVPVVGTDHGGTPEVIDQAGLLVPPGNPEALAEAVGRLLDDSELSRRCADRGPAVVAERYAADARLSEFLDHLEAAAGRGRQRGPAGGRSSLCVIASPDFDPVMGGTSRQARRQAEGLRRLGHDTVVLTRRRRRTWSRSEVRDGVAVRRFIAPGHGALGDKASVVFLACWLGLRRTRVASVQAIMYPDFAVGSVAAGLGARTVMVWAGLGDATDTLAPAHDPVRRWQRRARHRLLRSCRHVAVTPSIRDELLALSIPSSKIDVIPVPVDVDRFRPPAPDERGRARADLGLSPDQLVVVYTGHLRALKGIDRLVEAFGRLVTEGPPDRGAAVLLLVGGGNAPDANEDELRAQVTAAGLDRSVVFSGVVEDIVGFLWAADVFVLPSRREGLSNSLIEAMACGLACVAGAEAGGDQVLGDGAGIVPDSNESADLYDALCRLERDAALRARLGAAARQRTEQMSVERVAESYDTVLRQMTPSMKRTKRKS